MADFNRLGAWSFESYDPNLVQTGFQSLRLQIVSQMEMAARKAVDAQFPRSFFDEPPPLLR